MSLKSKEANLKTVKKWEKEFEAEFEYDLRGGKVCTLRCLTCKRWEPRIRSLKNFSPKWISPGSTTIDKDCVKKHIQSLQHQEAVKITKKSLLGDVYKQLVVEKTPIGQGLKRMCESDRKSLNVKFNCAYYLAKQERPYRDYSDLLSLHEKNGVGVGKSYLHDRAAANFTFHIAEVTRESLKTDLANANFYSVLNDGSTDSGVIEQELIYVLFLNHGTPTLKYFSIESVTNANAEGIKETIATAFSRFGISNFSSRLLGLNVDGASVNVGVHRGLGTLIKEQAPWLSLVHCFNHRVELSIKDSFKNSSFASIDELLTELCYLYQKSPKRLRELRTLAEAMDHTVPKPSRATGTRWIDHKYQAMKKVLENWGVYMTHIESLSQTDSQPKKRAELQGFLRKWKHAKYVIHIAIYLDVLAPIRQLSLGFQQNLHDPVRAVKRITDFTWIMAKLTLLIDQDLESKTSRLTFYKRLILEVEQKIIDDKTKYVYQDIVLKKFKSTKSSVKDFFKETLADITNTMNDRFSDVLESNIFKCLVQILDVHTWPKDEEQLASFGTTEISDLVENLKVLLGNASCKIENILPEWDVLKTHMIPLIKNNSKSSYLDIWKTIFTNNEVSNECKNVLMIAEILLITPFSNAKLERMFSRMSRVKTDWRSRLSCTNLDALLRIGEEGPDVSDFDPSDSIDHWFSDRVRRLTSSTHKYPEKRKCLNNKSVVDIAMLALSDLEDEDSSVLDDLF